ncbi:MAG: SDR family oxidoreductase [Pyrinomonadaceae bacterium MAG19_C2-C3]|nr:SDR family oxidoreductase [Pyrinomonadaceae bacterium MAG19_C2-C3]
MGKRPKSEKIQKRSKVFAELYPEFVNLDERVTHGKARDAKRDARGFDMEAKLRGNSTALFALAGLGALFAVREVVRRARAMDMAGKVVVITGGSRGLGLVMARQLADEGARIAICARDAEELRRAQNELTERGADVLALPCNITQQAQVEEFVRAVENRFGAIDVLINNAGIIQVAPMDEMTHADYTEAMNINFYGALNMTLAVLPIMKRRKRGNIVNIISFGGKVAVPHMLPYTASKRALAGFSEGSRVELRKHNVTVTSVYPGPMRTGSHVNVIYKGQNEKEAAWFSTTASTPVLSMQAERAASQIITGFKQGRAQVVMPLLTELQIKAAALAPAVAQEFLVLVDKMMPASGGIGKQSASGKESGAVESDTELRATGQSAATRNNEL